MIDKAVRFALRNSSQSIDKRTLWYQKPSKWSKIEQNKALAPEQSQGEAWPCIKARLRTLGAIYAQKWWPTWLHLPAF